MANQHKNGVAPNKTSLHQQQFFLPGRPLHHKRQILHLPHQASHFLPTIRALTATMALPTPTLRAWNRTQTLTRMKL
eukprot:12907706-Prorocentrum_lima.AAC.1